MKAHAGLGGLLDIAAFSERICEDAGSFELAFELAPPGL